MEGGGISARQSPLIQPIQSYTVHIRHTAAQLTIKNVRWHRCLEKNLPHESVVQ